MKELFSGENDKIIIPDLQRDYCWGNPYSKDREESLVDSFLDSIIRVYKLNPDQDITMGLIYGYFDELKSYQLQLCDGQQRLTTLFLIMGVINRYVENKYRELLISNFELKEDDKEPHLLYGIRESSLYFLSDLTTHYFLDKNVAFNEIRHQFWFLNIYDQDPTILSILRAIETITNRLKDFENIEMLGDFLQEHLKFLFYDMDDRRNGEETFVVINITGEPLSANQNLKPLVILENPNYCRIIHNSNGPSEHNTAQDWEEMETWFWQHRHLNDADTSTEGMLAFLHCVRVLESHTETDWHRTIDINDDKFPVTIRMSDIWDWFCAYKRMYQIDYSRLSTPNISYPDSQPHYTQKDLYSILPTMLYCKQNIDATDEDIQRVYHLFNNMGRYRTVTRSSQKEAIRVPAYRACQLIKLLPSKDILSLLNVDTFDVDEEIIKLSFLRDYKESESKRHHIEELFADAERFKIYNGQISTLVKWSESSIEKLDFFYDKIKKLWIEPESRNKLRRALLAFRIKGYPMPTGNTNWTLCSDTEWRVLFENQGEQIVNFINNSDNLDDIIANHNDENSQFYPLIHDASQLDFSKDHKIRVHPQGVVELMEKTKASANFRIFHRNQIFEKNMVDMENWIGFWVWSDGNVSVFYSDSLEYNLTLDMRILDNGYQIVAWVDRKPAKISVKTEVLEKMGFKLINGEWVFHEISDPQEAKNTFKELSIEIIELSSK